jgi:hypothetical protein
MHFYTNHNNPKLALTQYNVPHYIIYVGCSVVIKSRGQHTFYLFSLCFIEKVLKTLYGGLEENLNTLHVRLLLLSYATIIKYHLRSSCIKCRNKDT